MIDPILIDDQVNILGIAPFFERAVFVEKNVDLRFAHGRLPFRVLVYEVKVSLEIKNEATAVLQWAFEENFGRGFGAGIEKLSEIGERKIRRHPRDAVDHTQARWHHGDNHDGGRKFFALPENEVERDR